MTYHINQIKNWHQHLYFNTLQPTFTREITRLMSIRRLKRVFLCCLFIAMICHSWAMASPMDQLQQTIRLTHNDLKDIPTLIQQHYKVLDTLKLPAPVFNEGMVYANGYLYMSSGLYDQSQLLKYSVAKHKIVKRIKLPARYFAEGITLLNNKLYQLTYLSNKVFVYDARTLKKIDAFNLPFQAWGLTTDGKQLILSNGSSALVYIDPNTHKIDHFITVTTPTTNVVYLNDLQYVHGKIYANIFYSSLIVAIDPKTGKLSDWLDINPLWKNEYQQSQASVPNGIAYNPRDKSFFISGKQWQTIYRVAIS